jgi:RimJ/RimL family protein N-acetyltransferase
MTQPEPPRAASWPPARVVLTTPRLELRLPSEDELWRLAEVAAGGVCVPGTQPFGTPWGDQPPRLRARSVLQWHWATRGSWSPDRWTLDFTVFHEGAPVGAQGLSAAGFPVRREVATGSWLGLPYQRQGFGTEMRAAVLTLAFGPLGALSAVTGAFQDNAAAIGVSRALGYADDGTEVSDRGGARVLARRFRLAADAGRRGWPAVTIDGAGDEVLRMCGALDPAGERALALGGYPHA